jgi:hypothetical protein
MPRQFEPAEILTILSMSIDRIESAIEGLGDADLACRTDETEWSPVEILAHLRACADVWGDVRIEQMLSGDEPIIAAVNPRTWIRETDYSERPFSESLAAFRVQRLHLLEKLEHLSASEWDLGATMTGGGKPRRTMIRTEADGLARHERAHIGQIEQRCADLRTARDH